MAKIEGPQDIPAALLEKYEQTLTPMQPDDVVRSRYPFRIPNMQNSGSYPSAAQREQRDIFRRCVDCYNVQPQSGGATPPTTGPRGRDWWFADAIGSGLWYYDYFMQTTLDTYIAGGRPDWCWLPVLEATWVYASSPNTNYWSSTSAQVGYGWRNGDMESWIKIQQQRAGYIMAYMLNPETPGGGWKPMYLDVCLCSTAWNYKTLTWNNKPAIDSIHYSVYLTQQRYNWVLIPIPAGYSIVLKGHNIWDTFRQFASYRYAVAEFKMYWSA